jgi:hypothetical protein
MTWTRKLLRQRIGGPAYLGDMTLFEATSNSITSTTLVDNSVTGSDNTYNRAWIVIASGTAMGDYRHITAWDESETKFTVDRPFTATIQGGDPYELHTTFNPADKDCAINQAIYDAKLRWPRVLFAETILMADNTYRYTLANTTLTNAITSGTVPGNGDIITVGSTANFPSSGRLKIGNEYIAYSAVASSTTFMLASSGARGANSSTAAAHDAGAEIGICPGFDKYAGLDLLEHDAGLSGTGPPWVELDDDYYDIVEDNGVLYLQLTTNPPHVGNYIRLTYRARPLQLSNDATALDPNVEPFAAFICAKASAMLCQQASMRAGEEAKQAHWNRMFERFRDEAETYKSADMAPKAPGRIKYPTWGDANNRDRRDHVDLNVGRIRI